MTDIRLYKNSYNYKKYYWKTGELSLVQGHEDIVLCELEKEGYLFKDILTSSKDMPEIWYTLDNTKRRYYPDFYIPSENLIIEVKSNWTLKAKWDMNQAKFKATKDAGFEFRLEIR